MLENFELPLNQNDDNPVIDADQKALIELCQKELEERKVTIWEAARQAGVDKEGTVRTYYNILRGITTRPEYQTLYELAQVCGVRLWAWPGKK